MAHAVLKAGTPDGKSWVEVRFLEPVLVRVFFPSVFVQVLVQVLVEFLILFRHCARPIPITLLNVAVSSRHDWMRAKLLQMDEGSIMTAAKEVRRGSLVVYPTDTVYGLGCDPLNQAAVRRLFEAKGREAKAVPVLCSALEKVDELVKLSPAAMDLASKHWPGALTIVAPLRRAVPPQLTQGKENLGVRIPAHPGAVELIASCGGRLTGTSANLSGRPSARTAAEAIDQLGDVVDVIIDGGRTLGMESTVVQVIGNEVTLLRSGPVGVEPR